MMAARSAILVPAALTTVLACTPAARDFGDGGSGGAATSTSATSSGGGGSSSSSSGSSSSSSGSSSSSTSASSSSGGPACTTNADCPGAANATGVCKVNGTCTLACNTSFEDCDSDPTNGCEIDLLKDKANCGACGEACFYGCQQGTCADPIDVSVGPDHACAVLATGDAYCWGSNESGQIGDTNVGGGVPTPEKVQLPAKALQIACGGNMAATSGGHTCARLEDGRVFCWGTGQQGQLGNGSPQMSPVPVQVQLSAPMATHVAAGSSHSCAIVAGGQAFCWGNNSAGQLGNGGGSSIQPTPVPVQGPQMSTIECGQTYCCGVDMALHAYCWGIGQYGKLGIGNTTTQPTPKMVSFPGALGVSAGSKHTCAWSDAQVACWGDNSAQALGVPGVGQVVSPIDVAIAPVLHVSAGSDFTAAALQDGSVMAWGTGYLGDGSSMTSFAAPKSNGMSGVKSLQVGGRFAAPKTTFVCALKQTHELVCWGDNQTGQLGNGTTGTSPAPVTVQF